MKKITVIPTTRYEMMKPRVRRVAIYARVSTDSDSQISSVLAQEDYFVKMVNGRPDCVFAGLYADEGLSGTSALKRAAFTKMLQDAEEHKFDLIITKSLSRFARNTVDSLVTLRRLKSLGIEVWFEKEQIWTFDGKGELMLTIISSVAQEECRSICENCTWGQRKRFKDGKYSVPYSRFLGYDKGEDGEFVVNHEEARIIKGIYFMFLLGMTAYGIANLLTEYGIPTPGKKLKWAASVTNNILKNEKYKGDSITQKSFTVDFLTKKKKKNEGELPKYYVPDGHEAIIPRAVHDYVQEEYMHRKEHLGRYCGVTPFLGRVICKKCGMRYRYANWHPTTYNDWVWECRSRWIGKSCGNTHIYEEEFNDGLGEIFLKAIKARRIIDKMRSIVDLPEFSLEKVAFKQADGIIAVREIIVDGNELSCEFLDGSTEKSEINEVRRRWRRKYYPVPLKD